MTSKYWYEVDDRGDLIALTDTTGNTDDCFAYLWGKSHDGVTLVVSIFVAAPVGVRLGVTVARYVGYLRSREQVSHDLPG